MSIGTFINPKPSSIIMLHGTTVSLFRRQPNHAQSSF
jgi:hypothetical protein